MTPSARPPEQKAIVLSIRELAALIDHAASDNYNLVAVRTEGMRVGVARPGGAFDHHLADHKVVENATQNPPHNPGPDPIATAHAKRVANTTTPKETP